MLLRPFDEADTDRVIQLWTDCGLTRPWNDPRRDIERKLAVQRELFIVGVEPNTATGTETGTEYGVDHDTIVATAMAGYDGHRGWVNYLAVDPTAQGRGYGRAIMAEIERMLQAAGCPKLNMQIRADNTDAFGFYEALGYRQDAAVSFGKRLIPDD
ncbi:GNAT family acetyltransferase [Marisediminicola senii]|uniref:GNAT family acetyltransferase n=1 Tax=Marisediminicola senii TaxID=2711233 RepID=UPI0013EA96B6|nr:GNAT family acetyltransferase [Marisediminicola senii]